MAPSSRLHDLGLKLKALAYYKRVGNKSLTARMFGVSEAAVRSWIKSESRLRAQGRPKIRGSDDDGAYSLLERSMVEFVNHDHKRGLKTKYGKLLEHAAQLKKAHKVKGLQVTLKWVTDFVTKQRLRSKCERLTSSTPKSNTLSKGGKHVRSKADGTAALKVKKKRTNLHSAAKKAASSCLKRAKKLRPLKGQSKVKSRTKLWKQKVTGIKAKKTKVSKLKTKDAKRGTTVKYALKTKLGKLQKGIRTKKQVKKKLVPKKADGLSSAAKRSLQKAKQFACCARGATRTAKAQLTVAQRLREVKPRRRRQPTKIFRTRYRIKEMRRKIEESRASDFFDFFYGLGLIPVDRDSDVSWSVPLLHGSPHRCKRSGFSGSDPPASVEGPRGPTSPSGGRRYLAWRPRPGPSRTAPAEEGFDPYRRAPSGIEREDVGPSCSGDGGPSHFSLLQQTETFFDTIQNGSLQSENAVSPGESPITPEQLAVVEQLFPPVGRFKCFSASDVPTKRQPEETLRQKLRPRSSEQLRRLADCFARRKRRADAPRKFVAVDPTYETPRKSVGWPASDRRAAGFPEASRSVLELSPSLDYREDGMLMKRLRDAMGDVESLQPRTKKEHFEEGVNLDPANVGARSAARGESEPDVGGDASPQRACFT